MDGRPVLIEVKTGSVIDAARANTLVKQSPTATERVLVVVGDLITDDARQALTNNDISWLDRRGRFWLHRAGADHRPRDAP